MKLWLLWKYVYLEIGEGTVRELRAAVLADDKYMAELKFNRLGYRDINSVLWDVQSFEDVDGTEELFDIDEEL